MDKTPVDESKYVLNPKYKDQFSQGRTREIIKQVLQSLLEKATYDTETTQALTSQVADEIKNRLKDQMLPRYKIIVQVSIGEQRGQGVRMNSKCFWDSNTDNYASEAYQNDTLFCVATAYGVYLY
mmetsp:Transcript_53327/g.105164  ORF Transcript_53327/g.105164 Transcript_53327/m.105164 type:complete len:125 (+) Transcript_53327:69-443(+)